MRRLATSALAALLLAGTGGVAQAQDDLRVASMFELGVYGGGAWTTDWFETGGEDGWAPELSPIFGVVASYFVTPTFGLRVHGAYMPQNLPENEDAGVDFDSNWAVNGWLYDLDLVFRPWIATGNGMMASTYFFLGGGGATTNIAGEGVYPGCLPVAQWAANDICVSNRPSLSTTGMAVAGLGADLFPLGPVGLFTELAVHGYDSPAHAGEGRGEGEDKITFTPRLVLGLKAAFGNLIEPVVIPPPPPVVVPPPPVVVPPPPVVVPPPVTTQTISVCVVTDGMLQNVSATYNTATGDTTVNGQPFSVAYPTGSQYAANATWFINNDVIVVNGRRYAKYGLPRVLGTTEVSRTADYQGVGVFTEAGATGATEVIYIPVRPGCEFQPYQLEIKTGAVRGE
ncbi:MAG TPA: hypothetical protein VFQ45_19740 [Longimicrobium sp.]|nr:hypothetical protein [Longimicrobium sp.]